MKYRFSTGQAIRLDLSTRLVQGTGIFLLTLLALSIIRFCQIANYYPENAVIPSSIWFKAYWMGMRFDAKWLAILFIPGWISLIIATFTPEKISVWLMRYPVRWLTFSGVLTALVLALVNYFYIGFYQSPINSLIFGLFEDDTSAILKTVWHDYPIIPCLLVLTLFLIVIFWSAHWLSFRWIKERQPGKKLAISLIILTTLLLAGLARGSFGVFPLRETDMAVSDNSFVNLNVPGGSHALYMAWQERKQNDLKKDPLAGVRMYGFSSPDEARRLLEESSPKNTSDTIHSVPAKKPHVVFALMEAFGRELINTHDPAHNDVLGRLAPYMKSGDFFSRAISVEHGTFPSLEGILFDTPVKSLTQSRYGHRPFSFSVMRKFRDAGYRTVFLTSGSGSWRGLDRSLLLQGFDEVHDQRAIQKQYPDAVQDTWGIPDNYMFRYASHLLEEADKRGEKVFLFMLSTTNHPPYSIPKDYHLKPVDPTYLPSHRTRDTALARSILETYQYANDSLGGFLDRLGKSSLANHTVVAITGDHNTRSIFEYPDSSHLELNFGVPILFHIPAGWKPMRPKLDQWTSHRDIFPTLEALVLGIKPEQTAGRNLYATGSSQDAISFIHAASSTGVAISDAGAITGFANPNYFIWQNGQLVPTSKPSKELIQMANRARATAALTDWKVRNDVLKK